MVGFLVFSSAHIVLGEQVPKTLAIREPEPVSLWIAYPLHASFLLLYPLNWLLNAASARVLRLFGVREGSHQEILTGPEIEGLVEASAEHGGIQVGQAEYIQNVFRFGELRVSDVMVHRTEMVTVDADAPPEDVVREVMTAQFTRIPLWRDKPENIIGVLHAKDLLRALRAADGDYSRVDIHAIMLPPWFVPDMRPLYDQLRAFRRRKTHFALVVDEYGEVEGLVTLEDLLEEIVGDISDEHDEVVAGVRPQPDGAVVVDGSVPIRELNRALHWHLPDDEATTIAGLVIHEARSIPEPGQSFTFHGFRFRVLRRESNRITALRITPLERIEARRSRKSTNLIRPSIFRPFQRLRARRSNVGDRLLILRVDRERMHRAREFLGQHRMNHAMALDPALPFEGQRHDMDVEMRLAAFAVSGMACVARGIVDDFEALRRKGVGQLSGDDVLHAHGRFRINLAKIA